MTLTEIEENISRLPKVKYFLALQCIVNQVLVSRNLMCTVQRKSKLPLSCQMHLIFLERNNTSLDRNDTCLISRKYTGSTNTSHLLHLTCFTMSVSYHTVLISAVDTIPFHSIPFSSAMCVFIYSQASINIGSYTLAKPFFIQATLA